MLLWEIGLAFVAFVVCCILTETEHWFWTTLIIIAASLGAQFLHVADLWGFIRYQAGLTALYVLAYLVVGVVWSFLKWLSFLLAFRRARRTAKEKNTYWQDVYFHGNRVGDNPLASANKGRIVAWISYWPFSLVGTLVNDPLHALVQWLFECLRSSYQRVADYIFRDEPTA